MMKKPPPAAPPTEWTVFVFAPPFIYQGNVRSAKTRRTTDLLNAAMSSGIDYHRSKDFPAKDFLELHEVKAFASQSLKLFMHLLKSKGEGIKPNMVSDFRAVLKEDILLVSDAFKEMGSDVERMRQEMDRLKVQIVTKFIAHHFFVISGLYLGKPSLLGQRDSERMFLPLTRAVIGHYLSMDGVKSEMTEKIDTSGRYIAFNRKFLSSADIPRVHGRFIPVQGDGDDPDTLRF